MVFGRVYKWRPESVLIECEECGERLSLFSASATFCTACGADHTLVVQEEELADRLHKDEVIHPWRYARDREDVGLPF